MIDSRKNRNSHDFYPKVNFKLDYKIAKQNIRIVLKIPIELSMNKESMDKEKWISNRN